MTLIFTVLSSCAPGEFSMGADGMMGGDDNPSVDLDSMRRYRVRITGIWANPPFVTPGNAHFSSFSGTVHSAAKPLINIASVSSPGFESLAESGNNTAMNAENKILVESSSDVLDYYQSSGIAATGDAEFLLTFDEEHSQFSIFTMIAPSPDWVVGLNAFDFKKTDGTWLSETEYTEIDKSKIAHVDAGTKTGNQFSLAGSDGGGVIHKLQDDANADAAHVLNGLNLSDTGFLKVEYRFIEN